METIIEPTPVDENDPIVQVRTDLWSVMNIHELDHQRDLLITRIATLQKIVGVTSSPAITNLYAAMQLGLQDLNKLIDAHQVQKLI